MSLPANVDFITVTWQAIAGVADSADDPDRNPDPKPLPGLKVLFTTSLNPPLVSNLGALPVPVTHVIAPVEVTTDEEGRLVGLDGLPDVKLIDPRNTDLEPHGWTWHVQVSGPGWPGTTGFSFMPVGESSVVNLALPEVKVPASPGSELPAWLIVKDEVIAARDLVVDISEGGGLVGPPGPGVYELWLEQPGNAGKSEAEFLAELQGEPGDPGSPGAAATITVGTVETVEGPGSVTNSGTSSAVVLDFEIPKGDQGDPGATDFDQLTNVPTFWKKQGPMTQAEFDALTEYDGDGLYGIKA